MNNKTVRINGSVYRLITATLGKSVLMSAECFAGPDKGNTILNLNKSRSNTAKAIKNCVRLGLVS